MAELPSGMTFLFTDLEDSTRLWEAHPDAMRVATARHDAILRDAVAAHGGRIVKTTGDGVHAVFATADAAVRAAVDCELAMAAESWSVSEPLRARIGIHTGIAELRDGWRRGDDARGESVRSAIAGAANVSWHLELVGLDSRGLLDRAEWGRRALLARDGARAP